MPGQQVAIASIVLIGEEGRAWPGPRCVAWCGWPRKNRADQASHPLSLLHPQRVKLVHCHCNPSRRRYWRRQLIPPPKSIRTARPLES